MTPNTDTPLTSLDDLTQLMTHIKQWGAELGFADVGFTDADLSSYEAGYFSWIEKKYHGELDYMTKHGLKRTRPALLEPMTLSIISCRMNYFDSNSFNPVTQLQQPAKAYVSRYALNKDYHKLMRKRLQQLVNKIDQAINDFFPNLEARCFSDSAPVLERPIAEKSGLGFTGKNSLIIHPRAGSWFFLGEIYLGLALPTQDNPIKNGCGPCTACIDECPTQAIVANGVVDATRCISYLTIEYAGSIDPALRPLMGNRIYGCDDCQLVCPWNKFTDGTNEPHFKVSPHKLDQTTLIELASWREVDFLKKLEGSPIRRIGFEKWQRNLCIALGNALRHTLINENSALQHQALSALQQLETESELVKEHQTWAISQRLVKVDAKTTWPGVFTQPNRPAKAKKYYLPTEIKKRNPT